MNPRDLRGPAEVARMDVQALREISLGLRDDFGEMTDAEYGSCLSRAMEIITKYLAPSDPNIELFEQFERQTRFFPSRAVWDYDPHNPPVEHEIEYQRLIDNYRRMRARLPGLNACISSIENCLQCIPEEPLSVQERREVRVRFLLALRQLATSDIGRAIAFQEIIEYAGLDPYRGRQAADDLVGSGHIEKDSVFAFALTCSGRDNAEELEVPTLRHAMSVNQFLGPVGVFQQGDHNTATVSQQVNPGPQAYIQLLDSIRQESKALPEKQRTRLLEQEENLREELTKSEPRWSRVAAYLQTASKIAESVKLTAPVVYDIFQKLGGLLGPHISP